MFYLFRKTVFLLSPHRALDSLLSPLPEAQAELPNLFKSSNLYLQQKSRCTLSATMHMPPHLALSPLTSRYTQVAQQFSYHDASVRLRIMNLINQLVLKGHPDNLAVVASYICGTLTHLHRTD